MSAFLDDFWVLLALKLIAIAVIVPGISLVVIYAELKIGAHMQNRIGPYFAGGRWGWAQPLADAVKFLQKEDLIPDEADRRIFKLAPMVSLMATFTVWVIIPFSPTLIVQDLDLGIFYALAVSAFGTLAVLMAGWASANKYSLMGGLRAAAQLIAYELPLILAVVGVVIQAGTMSMRGIVEAQAEPFFHIGSVGIPLPYLLQGQVIGFVIFMVAALAELSRIPFDLPIAESELVMGFVTEYSGMRFTMFFLAEYAGMVGMSAIAATLFLGGYAVPWVHGDAANWIGPFVLFAKLMLVAFLMFWARFTYPRLREDQLQAFAWKFLIPLGLLNLLVTALFKVAL